MAIVNSEHVANVTAAQRAYALEWMGDAQWFEEWLGRADAIEGVPSTDAWWEILLDRTAIESRA